MFESVINKALSLDPELINKLAAFQGRVIAVEVQVFNKTFYLLPDEKGLQVKTDYTGDVDTKLRGSPASLVKLAMQKDVAPMMLSGEVEISGDLKLGRAFKKIFSEMDIDWEEHTSSIIGDISAHHLKQKLGSIIGWSKRAGTSFKDDVADYLQEESRDVISAAELEEYFENIDQLRDDVDRLAARIASIKN